MNLQGTGHVVAPARPRARFLARLPWSTLFILLAMLVLTGLALQDAGSWLVAGNRALIDYGASAPMTTLDEGGAWRLFAARLQLGSSLTAALFLPFFWVASTAFERRNGSVAHLLVFLVVSAGCSVASMYFRGSGVISIGGGGPALALGLGAWLQAWRDPGSARWSWLRFCAALPFLALVAYGLYGGNSDLGSLGCGLLCGLVLGMVLPSQGGQGDATLSRRRLAALVAGLVLLTAGGWHQAPRPPYYWSEVVRFQALGKDYEERVNRLTGALDAQIEQVLQAKTDTQAMVKKAEDELLPQWRALNQLWSSLQLNPALPDAHRVATMQAYVAAQQAFWDATLRGWKGEDEAFLEAALQARLVNAARNRLKAETR